MKISIVHTAFGEDGVTSSIRNYIRGLQENHPDIDITLIGESFHETLPENVNKDYINWKKGSLVSKLNKKTAKADVIIFENPLVGIPDERGFTRTKAYKDFAEQTDKKVIYRIHDLVLDRPKFLKDFTSFFGNFKNACPTTDNVHFLTLTSTDKERLISAYGMTDTIDVLPDSIIPEDFPYHDYSDKTMSSERLEGFRGVLDRDNIAKPTEKLISYPVRVIARKNIEEALVLTQAINSIGLGPYKLIVTLPNSREEDYQTSIEHLAEEFNVPCSIGKAYKHIGFDKTKGFTIAELFAISDFVVTTSIKEGFGYAFIEPALAGRALIGRNIPNVTLDFQKNKMNLNHLYNESDFPIGKTSFNRLTNAKEILSDESRLKDFANTLNLENRLIQAEKNILVNMKAVTEAYNHRKIAADLYGYLI